MIQSWLGKREVKVFKGLVFFRNFDDMRLHLIIFIVSKITYLFQPIKITILQYDI